AAVLITIPPGGASAYVVDSLIGNVYYQILVQTTGPVNVTDVAMDGTGAGIPDGYGDLAGIYFEESSGTVNGVCIANEIDYGGGFGILAATANAQTVTVENSDFRNFDG